MKSTIIYSAVIPTIFAAQIAAFWVIDSASGVSSGGMPTALAAPTPQQPEPTPARIAVDPNPSAGKPVVVTAALSPQPAAAVFAFHPARSAEHPAPATADIALATPAVDDEDLAVRLVMLASPPYPDGDLTRLADEAPAAVDAAPKTAPGSAQADATNADEPAAAATATATVAESGTALDADATATDSDPPAAAKSSDWLRNRSARRFTLQLQSGGNLSSLKAFAKQYSLPKPQAVYRTVRDGKPWFGLVVGDYPSRQAAQRAAAQLIAKLPSLQPWVRDFGGIQTLPK
ncbi:MAG: SPOR domain-containing protein [Gammaproteobacteria bacterium]